MDTEKPKNLKAGKALKEWFVEAGLPSDVEIVRYMEEIGINPVDRGTLSKLFNGKSGRPRQEVAWKLVITHSRSSGELLESSAEQLINIYEQGDKRHKLTRKHKDYLKKCLSQNAGEDAGVSGSVVYADFSRQQQHGKSVLANNLQQEVTKVGSPKHPPEAPRSRRKTVSNILPARCSTFIGYKKQLNDLVELLSANSECRCISVEGIGGVGKTSLVLEAAHQLLDKNHFEAIAFICAKPDRLVNDRIEPRKCRERTLQDILRTIADVLDCPDLLLGDLDSQMVGIRKALTSQRTLLIVDNLETLEEVGYIRTFLSELPEKVKVVVTSRQQVQFDRPPIHLESLSEKESLNLIEHLVGKHNIELNAADKKQLAKQTCGIPAAIVYAIGQLRAGYLLEDVRDKLRHHDGDLTRFMFENSVSPLRGTLAHAMLMALTMFPRATSRGAIFEVAGVKDPDSFVRLQQLFLVNPHDQSEDAIANRARPSYDAIPLTREYATAELQAQPDFEREAIRKRWIAWCVTYAEKYGNTDFQAWNEYGDLAAEWENLVAAIDWCTDNERYDDFGKLWRPLKGYTHLAGCWQKRKEWMDWWIEAAEQRQDWATAVEAMFDRGRTSILIAQKQEQNKAIALFDRAWQLCETHQLPIRPTLAMEIAALHTHRRKFDSAKDWLDRLSEQDLQNKKLETHHFYARAEMHFHKEEFDEARELYEEALKSAESIDWQRAIAYIHSWLAAIAIEQGRLDEINKAEPLLQKYLPIVEKNQDRRCLAFYNQRLAKIADQRQQWEDACKFARVAAKEFGYLGMNKQKKEMNDLKDICSFS